MSEKEWRWQDDAECKDADTDLFFPGRGEDAYDAHMMCAACPVRVECLEYALALDTTVAGVWGGTGERERRRIRRARRLPVAVSA